MLLTAFLLHSPSGASGLVITESEPSAAPNGPRKPELLTVDEDETSANWEAANPEPTRWLRAGGHVQVETSVSSREQTGLLTLGASSVHKVLKSAFHLPLIVLSLEPTAMSQTASISHRQPTASMGAVEPDIVIYSDPSVSANEKWKRLLLEQVMALSMMLLSSSVTLVLAFLFWRNRKPPEREVDGFPNEEDFKTWRHGIFSCFGDMETCLWASFCPAIRWAGTVKLMGFMGFWIAFTICFGIELAASTTGDFAIWVVLAIVCAAMRQEMRVAYGMYRQGGWTYLQDFCLYCFCACCTIVQEARQAEYAYKVGYPIGVRNEARAPLSAHMHGVPISHPHSDAASSARVAPGDPFLTGQAPQVAQGDPFLTGQGHHVSGQGHLM